MPSFYSPSGAIFRQANTLSALEANYKTYQALQAANGGPAAAGTAPAPDSIQRLAAEAEADAMDHDGDDADGDDDADGMAVDGGAAAGGSGGGGGGRRGGGRVSQEFKDLVLRVLTENGVDTNRSSKMTQEEFLQLLAVFNAAGIHFA